MGTAHSDEDERVEVAEDGRELISELKQRHQVDKGNVYLHSCFTRYSGFIKMNGKPSRIAFTTQRFDTPV